MVVLRTAGPIFELEVATALLFLSAFIIRLRIPIFWIHVSSAEGKRSRLRHKVGLYFLLAVAAVALSLADITSRLA